MAIGNIISELRKERGISQQRLADAIGVNQATIAKMEVNRNEASAETIRKLATFFDISSDYLLGLEDDFGPHTAVSMNAVTSYSSEERELIANFRELNNSGKKLIIETIKTLRATIVGGEQINKRRI